MKKILFFVMAAALFCGCKKENGGEIPCPVAEVEMPASSAENPLRAGAEVTLQGKGFTQSSEIWLRSSAEARAAQDVKANVTSVTASSITFEAPEVYGVQTVVLKQDGGEWSLGVLTFADQSDDNGLLPAKVSTVKVTNNDKSVPSVTIYEFTYDEQGRIAKLVKTENETDVLTTIYTYSNNQISAEATGGDYIKSQKWRYDITDGRTSKYEVETVGGKLNSNIRDIITITYDENGYITSVEGTETDDEESPTQIDEKIVFTNGTLQKYTSTNITRYSESDTDEYTLEIEFVAGPLNNLNIDLMGIDWIGEYLYTVPAYMLNVGGERSLRLPKSLNGKYIDNGSSNKDDEYSNEFEYEMNGEYISVMNIYRDGQLETTVEIDYEK